MTDDELRQRLAALDPVHPDRSPAPMPGPRAHEILEQAMTQLDDDTRTAPKSRKGLALLAAAAGIVALGIAGVVLTSGEDGDDPATAPTTLALTAAPFDPLTSSCLPFDASTLATFPVAFAGTATTIEGGTVTLDVDRWYRGGDADLVLLDAGPIAALDGVDFAVGTRYLVTAEGGAVTSCGFSGPAGPELEQAYEGAFS